MQLPVTVVNTTITMVCVFFFNNSHSLCVCLSFNVINYQLFCLGLPWQPKNILTAAIFDCFNDFEICENNKCQAKCLYCDENEAPKHFTKGNATNLKTHLKKVSILCNYFVFYYSMQTKHCVAIVVIFFSQFCFVFQFILFKETQYHLRCHLEKFSK